MSTKVLVFESDPAFAGELRTELGKLGCNTTVVEDGNVGLQQASSDKPDLILLSIELPRMNGFSVCNKLKKDASLKDVPLIIMSSESSDETFEQHKKLRTRAEDYVHKPIAFGELLQHIQGFVPMGSDAASEAEAAIVIEEDIDAADYLVEDDAVTSLPSTDEQISAGRGERPKETVDADVEAFAESAFGRLTEETPAIGVAQAVANGAVEARSARKSVAPARTSVRPSPGGGAAHVAAVGIDPAEHEKVIAELARTRERASTAETDLAQARREVDKLKLDAAETDHLTREVEELKTKIAASPKAGGVSSREFLDLREGLNRKDKEILALKEQTSKKDKEIVETQEKMLALERSKADLDDKLLSLEREIDEAKEKAAAVAAEADKAKKASDDLKARLERAQSESDAKDKALAEVKAKSAADVSALEAKVAAVQAEVDRTLASERADHGKVLEEAEARRNADLEQLGRDHDAVLVEASEKASKELNAAVEARGTQLAKEHAERIRSIEAAAAEELRTAKATHEAEIAAAKASHQSELDKVKSGASEVAREADQRHAEELATARKDGEERLARAQADAAESERGALEGLRAEHTERVSSIENDRDARIATLESKAARELGEANDRLAKLEVDFSGVRGELESLRETKRTDDETYASKIADLERRVSEGAAARAALEASVSEKDAKLQSATSRADRAQAKWDADKGSLDRAKDALAVALAQIEEAEGRSA